jgi:hypothetical protein
MVAAKGAAYPWKPTAASEKPRPWRRVGMFATMSTSDEVERAITIVLADDHQVVRAGCGCCCRAWRDARRGEAGDVPGALRLVETRRRTYSCSI